MAGDTHHIDIGDDGLLPPWGTVFAVATATNTDDWVLVGGLMVQLHAYRAQIRPPRPTRDVDVVVNVAAGAGKLIAISAALQGIGFKADLPASRSSSIYRFTRREEQVDVMVPDHLPKHVVARVLRRPAFEVPAGEQAIRRRDWFVINSTSSEVTIGAPDILGALIAKGAAFTVDSRDRGRHMEDAAALLAAIPSVQSLDLSFSTNDRRRLTTIEVALRDDSSAPWQVLDEHDRKRGHQNLQRIRLAARLEGA